MPSTVKVLCNESGCETPRWKNGKCWFHHPTHVAARAKKAGKAPLSVKPVVAVKAPAVKTVAGINDKVEALPGNSILVVNRDGNSVPFGVDKVIWMALEEAFQAKKHDWMVELSGMKPGRAICLASQMIRATESLGY